MSWETQINHQRLINEQRFRTGDRVQITYGLCRIGDIIAVHQRKKGKHYVLRHADGKQSRVYAEHLTQDLNAKKARTPPPVDLRMCSPIAFVKSSYKAPWRGVVLDYRDDFPIILITHDRNRLPMQNRNLKCYSQYWLVEVEPFDISYVPSSWFLVDANRRYWKR